MTLDTLNVLLKAIREGNFDDSFYALVESLAKENTPDSLQAVESLCMIAAQNKKTEVGMTDRLSKLEKANKRLLRLLSHRQNYFDAVSHELRTPLNIIVSYADALKEGVMGEMNPEQTSAANKIERACNALLHTVNDLLDLSKLEADAMSINPVEIEYPELIRATVDLMQGIAATKRIRLSATIDEDISIVYADPERTEQVLRNLIYNAIKFTPEGGEVRVDVQAGYPPRSWVITTVSDTGIGIPKNALTKIFQPFVQVDNSLTRSKGGTGLGLAICKALTEKMGGVIRVDSKEGEGATFTFDLPATIQTHKSRGLESFRAIIA